jgi:hypothetical protein
MLLTVLESQLASIPLDDLVELQRVVLGQGELGLSPEDGAAVYLAVLPHGFSCLLLEHTIVT